MRRFMSVNLVFLRRLDLSLDGSEHLGAVLVAQLVIQTPLHS